MLTVSNVFFPPKDDFESKLNDWMGPREVPYYDGGSYHR